jgi:hypothetical protein
MPALANPRHERFAQLIFEGITTGEPKPYSASHAYIAAGYTAKDAGKRCSSAQAASSRLLFRVIHRVRELQAQAAEKNGETAEKITRELNEVLQEARADKAHSAAVSAIATKAKILNIGEQKQAQHLDYNTCQSLAEIACKLLQSVGFHAPDDVSIQQALELNHTFVAGLERIRDQAQQRLIEQR